METAKVVRLTDKYWEIRLAWLDGKYKTGKQKDKIIEELLKLFHEALQE